MWIRLEMTFVALCGCLIFALFVICFFPHHILPRYCGVSVPIIVFKFTTILFFSVVVVYFFFVTFGWFSIDNNFGLAWCVCVSLSLCVWVRECFLNMIRGKKSTPILSKCFILHRPDKIANITSSLPLPLSSSSSSSLLSFAIHTSIMAWNIRPA